MSRAATSPEVTKYASDGQYSEVYAHVFKPTTVFAARVNQSSIKRDRLSQLTFDTVTTGSYSAVQPGMTVLIGSTSGAHNAGIGWARKAATSTVIYLGETSNLDVSDNYFITVLNDFSVWAKHALVSPDGSGMWINYDETYTDQLSEAKPVIRMGSDRAVEMTGASVDVSFSLSATVAVGTAGVFGFVSSCATASATSNLTTDIPTFTFNTTGDHLIKTVCTSPGGKTSTTYRWVYIWNKANPPTNCILDSNDGDQSGWSASVTMYERQTQSDVRDRAKVIVFAKDYYAGTLGSIGSLTGCENIVIDGWIAGQSIVFDADKGSVSFDIKQAGWWLEQEQNTIEVALIASSTDANWHHMTSVTIDRMLWHLAQNYSTLLYSTDLYLTGDTRTALSLIAPLDNVWAQMANIADRIKAVINTNQYGQVHAHIDLPLIPYADRSGIPIVVALTKDDFAAVDIEVIQTYPTSQVIVTGQLSDGSTVASIGGGRVPNAQGQAVTMDNLVSESQSQQNILAGSLYARDNVPYKFSIRNLRGNNRLIDITPEQRVGLTLTAADNLRGIAYDDYVIVRSISRSHDPATGGWTIDLEADTETRANLFCTGDIPADNDPDDPDPWKFPDIPFPKYPGFDPGWTYPPDGEPDDPDPSECPDDAAANGAFLQVFQQTSGASWVDGSSDASKRVAYTWGKCTIRSGSATNKTYVQLEITNKGLAYENINLYAIDGAGNILLTGVLFSTVATGGDNYMLTWTFAPASATVIAGMKLVMNEGLDPIGGTAPKITFTSWQDDSIYDGLVSSPIASATVSNDSDSVIRAVLSISLENTFSPPLDNTAVLKINFGTETTSIPLYYLFTAVSGNAATYSRPYINVGAPDNPAERQGSYQSSGTFGVTNNTFLNGSRFIDVHHEASGGPYTGIYTLIISSTPEMARSAAWGYGLLYNICPAVTS